MKGGTILRMAMIFGAAMAGLTGRPQTKHYDDPVFKDPRDRRKKRSSGVSSRRFTVERKKLTAPPKCRPGTITYHDKLVRHFGRKKADWYGRLMQHRDKFGRLDNLHLLPTAEDFAANPPWAWRSTGNG